MANTEEYDLARDAVARGVATSRQKDLVAKEAKQAGLRGSAARAAIQRGISR